jgi:hypothetical protein
VWVRHQRLTESLQPVGAAPCHPPRVQAELRQDSGRARRRRRHATPVLLPTAVADELLHPSFCSLCYYSLQTVGQPLILKMAVSVDKGRRHNAWRCLQMIKDESKGCLNSTDKHPRADSRHTPALNSPLAEHFRPQHPGIHRSCHLQTAVVQVFSGVYFHQKRLHSPSAVPPLEA